MEKRLHNTITVATIMAANRRNRGWITKIQQSEAFQAWSNERDAVDAKMFMALVERRCGAWFVGARSAVDFTVPRQNQTQTSATAKRETREPRS